MLGILFMQKSLSKKIAVAVAARRAALKEKDMIDAYFACELLRFICRAF